ncbi:MAG TPA: hypothetical protein VJ839_06255 [Candidatus Limnocylindria bacterium]|nr:hypothetical protein [Candidatus Limnocylindria bacterium]
MNETRHATSNEAVQRPALLAAALKVAIVLLAIIAGAIHLSLGGMLFTLNALGYFGLAAAYLVVAVISHPLVVRFSWLPRLALIGYAATSIVAWMVIGGFYWLGYLTKGLELTLILLVVVDIFRVYGGVRSLARAAVESGRWALTAIRTRSLGE